MTWIKICGLTRYEDASMAVELGANAVGYIFADSKRQVKKESIKKINSRLPADVEKIGIFVNEKADIVCEIANYCGLTGLQFHGDESAEYCSRFERYKVIKAFRVPNEQSWEIKEEYLSEKAIDYFLFDTYVPGLKGGTGMSFTWDLVTAKSWPKPIIIAGGISLENITTALGLGDVYGIDICSGVEIRPGLKDERKLKQLFDVVSNSRV